MKNGENEEIAVHITGQVNKPGLVVLKYGDRVIDAIEKSRRCYGQGKFR